MQIFLMPLHSDELDYRQCYDTQHFESPALCRMNLLKSLATISSLTLVSRILAFVRDVLIARVFGAGMATDAFFVAFRLPNLLRRLFAEGAFSQAFVPIFGEYRNRRGHEETQLLVDHVTTMLAIILFVVTLIGIIAAPVIVYISAPGFAKDAAKFDLTVQLLRITTPYIFFISLVAVAAGILNTYNKFWVPAFAPILLNICFISAALWLAPYCDPPILALAWAVFVAGFVQLAFQVPFLKKIGMLPGIRFNWKDPGMRRVIRQMGPAVFGVSIGQISLLINTIFASFLVAGSVSWLYYADRLMEFPIRDSGCGAGFDPAAVAFQMPCRQQHGGIFETAGLGLAPDHHADAARRAGAGHDLRCRCWRPSFSAARLTRTTC